MTWSQRIAVPVVAAALVAGVARAGGGGAATRPGRADDLAGQFLVIGRTALRDREPARAVAALRRAVARRPELLEAHYLLAKACQAAGRTRDAVRHYRRVVAAVQAQDDPPPRLAQWKADAEARLNAMCVYLRRWSDLRLRAAGKLRSLAADCMGRPSAVRALEIAVRLHPERRDLTAKLAAARGRIPDVLPKALKDPDPRGAALLVEQASELAKAGSGAEALRLLRSAAGLSRDAPTLAALAEASLAAGEQLEAAVIADEAAKRLPRAGDRRNALARRIAAVRAKADPSFAEVGSVLNRFAADAERLARGALAGGDADTAGEIVDAVLALLPGRDSARRLKDRLRDARPTVARLPSLAGKWVDCEVHPARSEVTRGERSVRATGRADRLPGGHTGVAADVTFKSVTWGRFVRIAFRAAQASPPRDPEGGYLQVDLWPIGWGASLRAHHGRGELELHLTERPADYRILRRADGEVLRGLFRPDGSYEVAVEKDGPRIEVTVGGRMVLEVELSRARRRQAAGETLLMGLSAIAPRGRRVGLALTVREFACSADCLESGQ